MLQQNRIFRITRDPFGNDLIEKSPVSFYGLLDEARLLTLDYKFLDAIQPKIKHTLRPIQYYIELRGDEFLFGNYLLYIPQPKPLLPALRYPSPVFDLSSIPVDRKILLKTGRAVEKSTSIRSLGHSFEELKLKSPSPFFDLGNYLPQPTPYWNRY